MSIKIFGSKQFWSPLGQTRIMGPKQIKVENNWHPKNLGPKKYRDEFHQNKHNFRSQKVWIQKSFGQKKYWIQRNLRDNYHEEKFCVRKCLHDSSTEILFL